MSNENRVEKKKGFRTFTFKVSDELADRLENYLLSPVSEVKSKTELFSRALSEYLDCEEKIIKELEMEREKIKRRLRGL